jgi:hypothetical protein
MLSAIRITRHFAPWLLIALGVLVVIVLTNLERLRYAAVLGDAGAGIPSQIRAGVPFVIRDRYATQFCVSSRGGQPLPPFILPADQPSMGFSVRLGGEVQAFVPFVVRDRSGTQVCISSRGGRLYPPLVVP